MCRIACSAILNSFTEEKINSNTSRIYFLSNWTKKLKIVYWSSHQLSAFATSPPLKPSTPLGRLESPPGGFFLGWQRVKFFWPLPPLALLHCTVSNSLCWRQIVSALVMFTLGTHDWMISHHGRGVVVECDVMREESVLEWDKTQWKWSNCGWFVVVD